MKVCSQSEGGLSVINAKCIVKVNGMIVPYVMMVDTDDRIIVCFSNNKKITKKITSLIERYADGYTKTPMSVVSEAYTYRIQIKKSCVIKLVFKEKDK